MFRRTTIADIARHAGVSVGTVSNVLNGKGRHAEDTRKRVLRAVSDLNFAPNALIRSLQSGKTHTIGVFTWRVTDPVDRSIGMRLLRGLFDGIGEIRRDTLLYSRHPHEGDIPVSMFLDGRVDGLIVAPGGLSTEGLQLLAASRLPVVALYQCPVPDMLGAVNINNVGGVLSVMDHLVELGHRRIAFVAPDYTFDYRERQRGYRLGLERNGLPFDPALRVIVGGNTGAELEAACKGILSISDPPTAVVAGDDGIALGIKDACDRMGVDVPRDLSLAGFDDAPAAGAQPGLTTVRQPAEAVGRTAAAFVYRLLGGQPAECCRTILPVELVLRGTTAPPCPCRTYAIRN